MAEPPHVTVRISAFDRVPSFARGQVRDLRVRWALEGAGFGYCVRLLDLRVERPRVVRMVENRLDRLAATLGDRERPEGRFTAGDLLMASVLNMLNFTDLVERRPALAAYRDRCFARPAYGRALAAQLATFDAAEAA